MAQRDARGVDAKRGSQERRHPPAGEPGACAAQLRFKGQEVAAELRRRPGAELPKDGRAPLHQGWDLHRELVATAELVQQNLSALGLAQIAPVRHLDKEPEAIGQRRIQRLRAEILLFVVMVAIGGRVHGRPAIAQLLEFHPLHAPLVDDRKELVLEIGPRAVEFIDEDHFGIPDRRRRGDVAQRGLGFVGQRDAHQVVVVDERGVVEPVDQTESLGQPLQQEALGRAVSSDEEKRLLGCQGRQQHRLQPFPAKQAERAGQQRTDFAVFDRWTEAERGSAGLAGVLRVLIGYAGYGSRTKSTKNPPTFIRRRKVPWRFFVQEIALPHIDPFGSRHLAVSNGRLPDPVSRITPDAK